MVVVECKVVSSYIANVPEALKGLPIAFLIAGAMSIAFLGFAGLGG